MEPHWGTKEPEKSKDSILVAASLNRAKMINKFLRRNKWQSEHSGLCLDPSTPVLV